VTKLGRLVKAGRIKSMEEIYLHSLPIKEYQIVDHFLPTLKDEVMKVGLCITCQRFGLEPIHLLLLLSSSMTLIDLPFSVHRSNPSRNRPVPASAPDSRPSS
jgi:hypothetical protein